MWRCTNCQHLEIADEKPPKCPVCGIDANKIIAYNVSAVKGIKTLNNLQQGFIGESKAHLRNLAFALKAEQEGFSQIAKLFRAISEAEGVHAFHHLRLLGGISDTQENLKTAFERENLAQNTYPRLINEAQEEGNEGVATVFSFSRDVERGHANLYEKALDHMMAGKDTTYYVCSVCGYVSDGLLPDQCPICGASQEKFRQIS